MRYVLFCRVSGKKQDTEMQILEGMNYINSVKKDGDTVHQFDEKVMTTRTKKQDRPVLKSMLEFLKKGDTLVIYKLSRLARGFEMSGLYQEIVHEKGVNLVSLYEKEITDEMIHAYALVAAFERKNIQGNTISGLNRKKGNKEKVGACLYGYTTDPEKLQKHKEDCHSYGKPYLLIPDEREQACLQRIRELRGQNMGYDRVAETLKQEGFRTRKGNPFIKSGICRLAKRLERQEMQAEALSLQAV